MTDLSARLTAAAAAAAAAVGLVLPVLAAGAARAHDDDRVERDGRCSNGARWEIKAKPDDGRIEVEAEIDSGRAGQSWMWVLKHNGSVSARGTSRTRGSSGSFDVERNTVDVAGTDSFRFRATRKGASCVAKISY